MIKTFYKSTIKSVVSLLVGVLTTVLIFKDIPTTYKNYCFIAFVILLTIIYLVLWVRNNTIKRVELNINNSKINRIWKYF
ncbi:MAG: hypothetical protein V8S33_14710 [Intestinibacter bartlettii]